MPQDFQDVAQICLNGHIINAATRRDPQFCKKFCDKCGAATIIECPTCRAPIAGEYHLVEVEQFRLTHPPISHHFKTLMWEPPAYCSSCGKPYPWTKTKIKNARSLVKELSDISARDKKMLISGINDIVKDTPNTQLTAHRFKKILARAGKKTAEILTKMLIEIGTDMAKKAMGLP